MSDIRCERCGFTEIAHRDPDKEWHPDHWPCESFHTKDDEIDRLCQERDEALRGWKEMTDQAGRKQREHLQHHEGDVYHAMQALKVRYGCKRKLTAIEQEEGDE
jgi:hypothetical protein